MDPATVTAAVAISGAVAQGVGGYLGYGAEQGKAEEARFQSEAASRIAQHELQIEAQKYKAMELDAKRRNMEAIRINQRQRAAGLVAATSQGAGGGSGLQGGYGSASGALGTSLVNVFQNLEIGRTIFGINAQITNERQNIYASQGRAGEYATQGSLGSGISSLGGSAISASQSAGRVFGTTPTPSYQTSGPLYG